MSGPHTQPLAAKVTALMDYMLGEMHKSWEMREEQPHAGKLASKMRSLAKTLLISSHAGKR